MSDFQKSQALRDLKSYLSLTGGVPIPGINEALTRAIHVLEKLPRFLRELSDDVS